ncbi:hypothetical protein BOTNAR_3165g00010 [Botryotinia narcissicola]|uniref:Uncharacterized protein n=1 Tax=Botryotinia narcissicola TaxID=278944 RepID=A0A4Z1H9V8_9HELO|nr:hypothetical protein BOTNAR_3165g00010 [Botryotinia narcissicola]
MPDESRYKYDTYMSAQHNAARKAAEKKAREEGLKAANDEANRAVTNAQKGAKLSKPATKSAKTPTATAGPSSSKGGSGSGTRTDPAKKKGAPLLCPGLHCRFLTFDKDEDYNEQQQKIYTGESGDDCGAKPFFRQDALDKFFRLKMRTEAYAKCDGRSSERKIENYLDPSTTVLGISTIQIERTPRSIEKIGFLFKDTTPRDPHPAFQIQFARSEYSIPEAEYYQKYWDFGVSVIGVFGVTNMEEGYIDTTHITPRHINKKYQKNSFAIVKTLSKSENREHVLYKHSE